jgi:hypothetical protein
MEEITVHLTQAEENAEDYDLLELVNDSSDEALEAAAALLGIATNNAVCTGVCTHPKC